MTADTRVLASSEVAMVRAAAGDRVAQAALAIEEKAREIAAMFRPGVRVTVLVRSPDHPDGRRDMIVTADDIDAIIAAFELRRGL